MIAFILGTPAELIKVNPVMKRLAAREVDFEIWSTYQHTDIFDRAIEFLDLPKPAFVFAHGVNGKPIAKAYQMIPWLISCFSSFLKHRKILRQRLGTKPLVIIHGDTVTTVFGAIAAKFMRVPSAHIEAGLRSKNLLRPFPEEIDRRIVGRLATTHFAPNAEAVNNLKGKDAVNTFRNTAVDGVLDTLSDAKPVFDTPYGLVLLHRFELMTQPALVTKSIQAIEKFSPIKVYVLTDIYSDGPIANALSEIKGEKLQAIPKLSYPDFVNAMAHASFMITDSGGAQQELGLLGTPTLLHRQVTESPDGIGANVTLSGWKVSKIEAFLQSFEAQKVPLVKPETSPSDVIVSALSERGYF